MDNGASSYRRFLAGEEKALADIIREYRDGLVYFICGYTGDIVSAEDIAEDVFVKLLVKRPHFSEKSSFKTWLYAIGANEAKSFLRKKGSAPLPLDEGAQFADEYGDPENAYFRDERSKLLHRCLMKLSPAFRQALWLSYFENLRVKDIAKVMQKNAHSVETLLYRAKIALKNAMEKEGYSNEDL
ncbi:MAG: RNA polymerase sigma factor [Clostridia bacterium]|nr:RNA polymerase sigma factor [Clostridia bacterium]